MITRILITLVSLLFFTVTHAADIDNINIQDVTLGASSSSPNSILSDFVSPISEFFFTSELDGSDGILN